MRGAANLGSTPQASARCIRRLIPSCNLHRRSFRLWPYRFDARCSCRMALHPAWTTGGCPDLGIAIGIDIVHQEIDQPPPFREHCREVDDFGVCTARFRLGWQWADRLDLGFWPRRCLARLREPPIKTKIASARAVSDRQGRMGSASSTKIAPPAATSSSALMIKPISWRSSPRRWPSTHGSADNMAVWRNGRLRPLCTPDRDGPCRPPWSSLMGCRAERATQLCVPDARREPS